MDGFPILDRRPLAPTIVRFRVRAPLVARRCAAGNFVIVRLDETGERIPLTVVEADPADGSITLIVQAVGKTTRALCAMRAGDALLDVVGPLGNPTPLVAGAPVACVGGGVGAAELLPIARALAAAGSTVHTIIGVRARDLVILEDELRACSASLVVTTDDGSYGRRGLVTAALDLLLAERPDVAAVYAIGPLPMMKAVARLAAERGVRAIVSLNPIMIDGTGMCGGCRVTVGGAMKFACVDGPEFDAAGVDFDELIARNASYAVQERIADERWAACVAGRAGSR